MTSLFTIVGIIGSLVCIAGTIMILIDAFSADVTQGILCLCVPCYAIYYVLARYEGSNKALAMGLYFGGLVVSIFGQVGEAIMGGGLDSMPH